MKQIEQQSSAQTVYLDAKDGTEFVSQDSGCATVSNGQTLSLGSSAATSVQNSLGVHWWALGQSYGDTITTFDHTTTISGQQIQIVYHPPPSQVTGLTTPTQSTSAITPRWNSATGATWYLLDRESPTGNGFSQITNTTQLNFADTGLTAGTQYNYKVFAGNSSGTSPASASSSNYTKPVAPTGLTTPTKSTTGIIPRWNSATGASWYLVKRESPTGGGFSQIANVTTLTYNNTGLVPSTQYNYEIFAGNSGGAGSASATSSNYTNPGVMSINNDITAAQHIIGVSGNTTVTTSGGTTTITLGSNTVTTNGAAQTVSKQMTFNSTVKISGNITSTAASGKTFKISAPPGVAICIGSC